MAIDIKCPNCTHVFPMEDAITEEYKKELREQMNLYIKKKDEEANLRILELEKKEKQLIAGFEEKEKKLATEIQQNIEAEVRKKITEDFETKLTLLEKNNLEQETKLKNARERELNLLQKEQALKTKEEELELVTQRKLQIQREELTENIRKQEAEKNNIKETEYQLKLRELEKQLEDQKKLAEEMSRKAEQGSTQLQGEVQELILEDLLKHTFPFDLINEVPKGVNGADCIHIVRNQFGQECGKIIYESKRTKSFSNEWIDKLKKDLRSCGADVAVIVTQSFPKEMNCFGEKDGVWICSFEEVKAVSYILRDSILKIFSLTVSQENKGDKMHLLYDYLTGNEFSEGWKAIREGFMAMKLSIQRERDGMERLWKAREKQLEKVLLSAAHIRGSIEGIAGTEAVQLNLTEDEDPFLLE